MGIKRNKASKGQLETLLKYSEKKSTNKEHYDFVVNLGSIEAQSASFDIEKLANKPTVSEATFKNNSKITEDPQFYFTLMNQGAQMEEDLILVKIERFNAAILKNDFKTATIIYIDIKDTELFSKHVTLQSEVRQLLNGYAKKAELETKKYRTQVLATKELIQK